MSNLSAQPSNYLDLTRRFSQSTPNTPTKRQKTAPRQTNAGHARSSPPISTQSRSLSTVNQPKQSYSHYRTQSQSSQPSPRAHLQSTSNTKMAKLRKQSAVNTANKGSPQPPAEKRAERVFEGLTDDSDSELPTQSKNSQQSKSMDKLSKQPVFSRTRSDYSSTKDNRQASVRPIVERQNSMPPLLDSEDELDDVHMSDYHSLFSPTIKERPTIERSQPLLSPVSSQGPAPTQTTAPT